MSTAVDYLQHLRLLSQERELARDAGLTANRAYMHDLEGEIAETRVAYVGAAVTELARLRAELSAPLLG
jgi:hypothetical protein